MVQEGIKEITNTEQNGLDDTNNTFENDGFKNMDYSLSTLEEDSEENPYIIYDKEQ
jgi:hypothetical protein